MHHIGILQLTQHLDDAVQGFKAGLAEDGPEATFTYLNADGNAALLPALAAELAARGAELIFACSTPAAKAAVDLAASIPVVFTPVFDPAGAGLLAAGKATGMAGMVPAAAKVAFMRRLLPAARTVGVLYHDGDANAVLEADNFRLAAAGTYELINFAVSRSDHLSTFDERLAVRPDALFLPIGRVVEENFATVAYYAELAGVPVVASSPANVAAGALGALTADHYKLGCACAGQAARILAGAAPSSLLVGKADDPDVLLNAAAARSLGLTLPVELVKIAREVYE
ncbi:MAG: ABC transporter substrate-binding protein [Sporomusaceae bacterium]|nr:ABC transporter substrate-binding protein [Sporomusaceae bacterium]